VRLWGDVRRVLRPAPFRHCHRNDSRAVDALSLQRVRGPRRGLATGHVASGDTAGGGGARSGGRMAAAADPRPGRAGRKTTRRAPRSLSLTIGTRSAASTGVSTRTADSPARGNVLPEARRRFRPPCWSPKGGPGRRAEFANYLCRVGRRRRLWPWRMGASRATAPTTEMSPKDARGRICRRGRIRRKPGVRNRGNR
jgi:hypothetical protein